ncbi:MAG: DUF4251 domain-containing protein [Bacteroidales bacterium]|nr:DUF4251 domain-containing protein [Bacteroidales bacterium]
MKKGINAILISLLAVTLCTGCAGLNKRIDERRTERKKEIEEGYEAAREAAFGGHYRFLATRVYPGSGYPSRDIGGGSYFLSVDAYDVKAVLPFYGTQYMADRPASPGIRIDGKMENIMIEESDRRHRVLIRFSVRSGNDNYLVYLDIGPDFNANLSISSSKRSTITYSGKVIATEEEEEER